jgi:outer membrane cobalamin receptor
MIKKSFLFFIYLLLFDGFSFYAQQTDTTNLFNLSIEELMNLSVYSASRKQQNIMEAPAILSIVPKKDCDKYGLFSLIDVLKFVPGIETSLGSDGSYRLAIRGNRKNGNILFLINGQQVNDFYNGKPLFDFPLVLIEKIEIIRGPGSALFGSNAVAGVINIFLIEENSISILSGNSNTIGFNGSGILKKEKISISLSGGYQQSDGTKQLIESDAGNKPGNLWDLTYDSLNQKISRWNKDLYLNLGIKTKKIKFYSNSINRNQSDYAGHLFIVAPGSKLKSFQNLMGLSYEYKANDYITIIPKIYFSQINREDLIQETPENYISNSSKNIFTDGKRKIEEYTAQTYGGELDLYIKLNEHLNILTGNLYEQQNLLNYNVQRNYQIVGDFYKGNFGNYDNIVLSQNNKNRFIFAYFIQTDYNYKKLNLTLGIRYDDYNDFGESFNPRMGLNYKINNKLRIKGLYGKAFRAPTFQELYDNSTIGNQYGVKGNDTLKPETIQTFELGIESQIKNLIVKYNGFYIENLNLIRVYDPHGGGSIGVFQNIGKTKTIGHELEVLFDIHKNVQFFANFSQYLIDFRWNENAVSEADVTFYENQEFYYQQLFNMPTIRINSGLTISHNKFSLFSGINYGNKSYNNNRFYLEKGSYVEIPSYLTLNFNFAWKIKDWLSLRLVAYNIGKKYADPEESTNIDVYGNKGLIQPGATYQLCLNFKL